MAFVKSVEKDDRAVKNLHPTKLACKYIFSETGGQRIIQLNTYGSDFRDVPGKLNQTLQFDEHSARQLFDVLKMEFGF